MNEPPPPPPPEPPRGFEAGERVGVEELAGQRAKLEQDALGQILGASPDDFGKMVTMHASEAEWIIVLRRAIQALCRTEKMSKLVPLSQDPPSASAATYYEHLH